MKKLVTAQPLIKLYMIKIHTQKKLLYSFLLLSLVTILGSCSKENMTVNMVGIYRGDAILNDWTSNYKDTVYKDVQIEITKVDWKTIHFNFPLDPNIPVFNISRDIELLYKNSFYDSQGGQRAATIHQTGSFTGSTLTYKYSYSNMGHARTINFVGIK